MSEKNPYEQLGVTESASFEEIQSAKTRLSQEYENDREILETIETAYDAVIMDRLKMRQEGRIKVPDRIRFPEKTTPPPTPTLSTPSVETPSWLQRLIDTPSKEDILWPSGVFAGLGAFALLAQSPSVLPLLLVGGIFANIIFINRKENKSGRAFLITIAVLILGISLGSILGGVLISSGLMIEGSQTQISALVTLVFFGISSCFLR